MEYKKDFDSWNIKKKIINSEKQRAFFREKEIWWCSTGLNIGSEQDGKGDKFLRPVLILKKINSRTYVGIPVTKTLREDSQYVAFYFNYDLHTFIVSQIKTYDAKRFFKKIGSISDYLYNKIKKAANRFIG